MEVLGVEEVKKSVRSKTKGSKVWAEALRKETKDLCTKVDEGYMDLARLLYTIYDTNIDDDPANGPVYKLWGFNTFEEYVRRELGMDIKRANRLKRIWYRLEIQLGKQLSDSIRQRLIMCGFSKVRELIRVVNAHNAEEWVERAESLGYQRLYDLINQYLDRVQERFEKEGISPDDVTDGVPEAEPLKAETFKLYPEQAANVERAIDVAKTLSKSDKKGHNLDLICSNFLATTNFTKKEAHVDQFLFGLENSMGLKLVAYDPRTGEIVYGVDTLEEIARTDNE